MTSGAVRFVCPGVLGVALAAAACAAAEEPVGLPSAPPVVHVRMSEYAFALSAPVRPGRVVFEVRNEGRLDHDLVLLAVPESFPPIDVELRNEERRFLAPIVTMQRVAPEGRGTFAVEVEPGRYALVCFVQDADGTQHAQKGMSLDLRVGPPSTPQATPTS